MSVTFCRTPHKIEIIAGFAGSHIIQFPSLSALPVFPCLLGSVKNASVWKTLQDYNTAFKF